MRYAPNKTSTPPICEHSLHIWTLHLPKLRKKLPEYTLALSQEERKKVINEAKEILDVEDVIASILLVEDLRIQKD